LIHHPVLDQLTSHGVKLGLDRVKSFLAYLGEPHRAVPIVHVAGTNGKGSVCTYVTAALVQAGYRVGTNLSPHLEAVNERIRFDGVPVDDARLIDAIEALDRERMDWAHAVGIEEVPLTYFEFLTVLAFRMFADAPVDVAVIEVGMGGRLDATNVVEPVVCAIPTIGLDHIAELGDTLALIAGEKAGILKRGVPVVIGPLPAEAREVIEARAKQLGSVVWKPGPEMTRESRKSGWQFRTPGGSVADVKLGMEGLHQGVNGLVAVGVLHQLRKRGFHVPDEAIKAGLEAAKLPGRLEWLAPRLVVDGAHNEDGANALAAWLATRPKPKNRILLLGMGLERDAMKLVAPLLKHFDEVVTTKCAHYKARESYALAAALEGIDVPLADGGPVEQALPEVYAEADEVVVAGSLYLVGAVRSLVRDGALTTPPAGDPAAAR
jgi:dihydrofolate synthase / folylpolyglutamate synthase